MSGLHVSSIQFTFMYLPKHGSRKHRNLKYFSILYFFLTLLIYKEPDPDWDYIELFKYKKCIQRSKITNDFRSFKRIKQLNVLKFQQTNTNYYSNAVFFDYWQ